MLFAAFGLVELPGAVNGPVTESAVPGEEIVSIATVAGLKTVACWLTERSVEAEV